MTTTGGGGCGPGKVLGSLWELGSHEGHQLAAVISAAYSKGLETEQNQTWFEVSKMFLSAARAGSVF